jgi:dTDP-glucose pyrophosphorylase
MAKSRLIVKKKCISEVLRKDNINGLLQELDKAEIHDIAIIFRSNDGQISSRWLGDKCALITLADILKTDLEDDFCQSESDD